MRLSMTRPLMALVSLSVMLTACAGSPARDPVPLEIVQPADPEVRTRIVERLSCPADLMAPAAQRPTVPPGATITVNAPGKAWLAALSATVDALLDQIADSQAACSAASVVDPAGLP